MKTETRRWAGILFAAVGTLLSVVIVPQSRAEDGITNIIDGITTGSGGTYMIGTNGAFNALIITNGGTFGVSSGAIIGNSATSSNNYATVTGAGSYWQSGAPFYVGNTGSFNQLTVASGGSILVQGDCIAGNIGSFNQQTISNGGVMIVTGLEILGNRAGANSNSLLVTGIGSRLQIGDHFAMGLSGGAGNHTTIANGGTVLCGDSYIGFGSVSNSVLVTDPGSVWSNASFVAVGWNGGVGNQLTITNGGVVLSVLGYIGASCSYSSALVSGTGSVWNAGPEIYVGYGNIMNQLIITDGGVVLSTNAYVGKGSEAYSNSAVVTGSGSVWTNRSTLYVGDSSLSNQVTAANGGTVVATNIIINYSSSISVANGNLYATNATSSGALDVRNGALTLNSGTAVVNRLYLTNNANSVMNFSAGTLRSGGSTVSNGVAFTVGDGVQSATLDLLGGTHSFADGLMLSTNSSLIGNGNIIGSVTNFSVIAPGHSVGTINITGDLTLADSSWLDMELAGPGTNDVLDISGLLAAGGGLKLTLTNGYTGNAGDTFDLFNFGSISGAFSQTNLPTLAAGMEWNTGHLYTLGEIRIVPEPGTGALLALGLAAFASRRVKSSKLRMKNSENS